jgi:hypothetical protein
MRMSKQEHILVCPYSSRLIDSISKRALVIVAQELGQAFDIDREVKKHNHLHGVLYITQEPLSSIAIPRGLGNIPVVIIAPRFGSFRQFLKNLDTFRLVKVCVLLFAEHRDNGRALKILSSLGIQCGFFFGPEAAAWNAVNEVMHFALYSRLTHAAIEPFNHLSRSYQHNRLNTVKSIQFDNCRHYLHVDEDGNVALTSRECCGKDFICSLNELSSIANLDKYKKRLRAWERHFLMRTKCSSCPAWRLCGGDFEEQCTAENGCRQFFIDFLEGIEFSRSTAAQKRPFSWQS